MSAALPPSWPPFSLPYSPFSPGSSTEADSGVNSSERRNRRVDALFDGAPAACRGVRVGCAGLEAWAERTRGRGDGWASDLAGGVALDQLGATMPNGLMLCALGMVVGWAFSMILVMQKHSYL